jgi:hypothetical protein
MSSSFSKIKKTTATKSMTNPARRRIPQLPRFISLCWTTLLLLSSSCFQKSCFYRDCHAKEIQVTSDWTVVGENDTIPAGAHVRMDLSTGEKWVKRIDENDDNEKAKDDASNRILRSSTATTTTAVAEVVQQTSSSFSPTAAAQGGGLNVASTATATQEEHLHQQQQPYDYEMMHRTLSQLPDQEKERMGGLPELPKSSSSSTVMDPVQYQNYFEQRMKEIWIKRQEELKLLSEEVIADLPELLQDRIQRLVLYLANPYQHLTQIHDGVDDDDENASGKDGVITDMVAMLQDLEYHLSDLDMTRDFYTLGGWPLLVSLLSDSAHVSTNTTNSTTTASSSSFLSAAELQSKVNVVQAHAAWAIGTAVKNTEEFHSFATEEVVVHGRKETPLSLLLRLIVAEPPHHDALLDDDSSFVLRQTKSIYGLSSLLRGNRLAQIHFCAGDGPMQLGTLLQTCGGSKNNNNNINVAKRLLTLAHDIVTDVELHAGRSPQVDQAIVQSFATEPWCQAVVQFLGHAGGDGGGMIQETALRTWVSLAPYCQKGNQNDHVMVEESLTRLQQKWESESNDMDPDHWQERKQLLEAARKLL